MYKLHKMGAENRNPPKFVPLTKLLGYYCWGTICIFQILSCQRQLAHGLKCYHCIYSAQSSYLTIHGDDGPSNTTTKCLEPDQESAMSKVCTPPNDKSCVKLHRTFDLPNGTLWLEVMERRCSDHPIDHSKQLCSEVETSTLDFDPDNEDDDKKRQLLERSSAAAGKTISSRKFKSRTKREVIKFTVTQNECHCDRVKPPNCNNEPGMKATDNSAPFITTTNMSALCLVLAIVILIFS